jgi:hypothetical protein
VAGGEDVEDAREVAVPRLYGGRGEELGGRESDTMAAMTGRRRGRTLLYDRDGTPDVTLEGGGA